MITKRIQFGMISILLDGQIQLREDTIIEENGKELSRTYHRRVLSPGDDTSKETDGRIQVIAGLLWTPEVIKAFKNKLVRI